MVPHAAITNLYRHFYPSQGETLPKMVPETCCMRLLRPMCLLRVDFISCPKIGFYGKVLTTGTW